MRPIHAATSARPALASARLRAKPATAHTSAMSVETAESASRPRCAVRRSASVPFGRNDGTSLSSPDTAATPRIAKPISPHTTAPMAARDVAPGGRSVKRSVGGTLGPSFHGRSDRMIEGRYDVGGSWLVDMGGRPSS